MCSEPHPERRGDAGHVEHLGPGALAFELVEGKGWDGAATDVELRSDPLVTARVDPGWLPLPHPLGAWGGGVRRFLADLGNSAQVEIFQPDGTGSTLDARGHAEETVIRFDVPRLVGHLTHERRQAGEVTGHDEQLRPLEGIGCVPRAHVPPASRRELHDDARAAGTEGDALQVRADFADDFVLSLSISTLVEHDDFRLVTHNSDEEKREAPDRGETSLIREDLSRVSMLPEEGHDVDARRCTARIGFVIGLLEHRADGSISCFRPARERGDKGITFGDGVRARYLLRQLRQGDSGVGWIELAHHRHDCFTRADLYGAFQRVGSRFQVAGGFVRPALKERGHRFQRGLSIRFFEGGFRGRERAGVVLSGEAGLGQFDVEPPLVGIDRDSSFERLDRLPRLVLVRVETGLAHRDEGLHETWGLLRRWREGLFYLLGHYVSVASIRGVGIGRRRWNGYRVRGVRDGGRSPTGVRR